MSSDNWMLWGLMSVGLLVIAVLLLTGGALIKIMFFDEPAEAFEPVEGKPLLVMAVSALFVVLFVVPIIGGTVVDSATAAASALIAPAR